MHSFFDHYDKIVIALVGIASGAIGYWFTTFWMKPILQYRELRSRILADLIFYAQVDNADGLNERMQKLYEIGLFRIDDLPPNLKSAFWNCPFGTYGGFA